MSMRVETLALYRHFLMIDSPVEFDLVANPTNTARTEGRDVCHRPAGAWVVDCWKLLPEKYHKLNPVFTMTLVYDDSELSDGQSVKIRYSDIDIGEGVAGVNGQLVTIAPDDFKPIVSAIDTADSHIVDLYNKLVSVGSDVSDVSSTMSDIYSGLDNRTLPYSVAWQLENQRNYWDKITKSKSLGLEDVINALTSASGRSGKFWRDGTQALGGDIPNVGDFCYFGFLCAGGGSGSSWNFSFMGLGCWFGVGGLVNPMQFSSSPLMPDHNHDRNVSGFEFNNEHTINVYLHDREGTGAVGVQNIDHYFEMFWKVV